MSQLDSLRQQGFDLSTYNRSTRGYRPRCSQCTALVINGVACHETGCGNATHECKGCNATLHKGQTWCEDCA